MASVYFVGRTVKVWHVAAILSFIVGTTIAVVVSVLSPASENSSLFYLFLCGVVATCSMILPGLSGSFVLILMGNYQLIMIDAVTDFRIDLLLPVLAGAVLGLIAFSHFLSWLLKRFPDSAIAVLSGFILGSIGILWPWKTAITQSFGAKTKIVAYNWELPQWDAAFAWALLFIILGILSIAITEIWAIKKQ
jgi:putative membrane protein